jgi:hypothetical protein
MPISHVDHDHPNTPAGRAKCRKDMSNLTVTVDSGKIVSSGLPKPAKVTVVPRKRGDGGVVRGMKAARPSGNLKRPGTRLRTIGDLPDVPRMLAYCARLAWAEGWEVTVGEPFNDIEANLLIKGTIVEIRCIWRHTLKDGIWALHLRRHGSSVGAGAASSALEAVEMAAGRLPLPDGK